jgi:hypothetical protein
MLRSTRQASRLHSHSGRYHLEVSPGGRQAGARTGAGPVLLLRSKGLFSGRPLLLPAITTLELPAPSLPQQVPRMRP